MPEKAESDSNTIPAHVAIIMDGNGRWAEKRGLPRVVGHKNGVAAVREAVETARELGIGVLTLYAFSTENWQRPPLEVQALMGLLQSYLQSELDNLLKNDISLRCIGQKDRMPEEVRNLLDRTIAKTSGNNSMVLNLALSYGSRAEIVMAAKLLAKKCAAGTLDPEDISDDFLEKHLYTAGLPDPDLLIRTGGECRLSNFLLWQASYSELYFTEVLWPDFRKPEFLQAIDEYRLRQRRFGKTGAQVDAAGS